MIDRRRPTIGRLWRRLTVGATLAALALTGCAAPSGDDSLTLDYWLWDANQLPAYQRCIDAFEDANPDLNVRISQYGYDNYWTKLTAAFVAGAGPDVFTDHLTRYPEYVRRDLLHDLDSLPATADIGAEEFQEGLADLWVGKDGKRYGMPKDFDTVALFYNTEMVKDAGLDPEDLSDLDWNPDDGGSLEKVLARLTVDANGVRGDEKGFDPDNVKVYGLASNGSGGPEGQTAWAWLAGATGWKFTNADVWGDRYNYDDPRLQKSLKWLFGLVEKGYLPPYKEVGSEPNPQQVLGSGGAAISANGSWMVNTYNDLKGIDLGIAPLPSGPVGHPVSMYNGLADSISAQTEHPDESARLVAFLGSDRCQTIVGDAGVVFPARPKGTDAAVKAFGKKGIDVSPFTDLVDRRQTVYFPVTDNFGSIESLMKPVMDDIYIGSREVETLTQINDRVNAMLD